jgi:hypothetical protein
VSPQHLRGTLGGAFQLGFVFLLFLAQIVSLHVVLGATNRWNYAFGTIVYKLVFFFFRFK